MSDLSEYQPSFTPNNRTGTSFVGQKTVGVLDADHIIKSDQFFPDISVIDFRKIRQIDDTYCAEQVRDVLRTAVIQTNDDLKLWRDEQQCLGFEKLAAVPSDKVDGLSAKILAYQRAVFSVAQALLNRRYWAVSDTTGRANNMSSLNESTDDYEADRFEALQFIREQSRSLTGLI